MWGKKMQKTNKQTNQSNRENFKLGGGGGISPPKSPEKNTDWKAVTHPHDTLTMFTLDELLKALEFMVANLKLLQLLVTCHVAIGS